MKLSPILVPAATLLLCEWAATARAAELQLRGECQAAAPMVTLGDLAEVLTADAEQARRLASLELFPAPRPGTRRFVRARELQDLLLMRGVNLAEHRLSGASQVAVTGMQSPTSDPEPRAPSSSAPQRSATPASETPATLPTLVVVAARPLGRGSLISAADVQLVSGEVGDGSEPVCRVLEDVVGKETRQAIAAGKVIGPDLVRAPVVVRRGEVVTVIARAAGLRVRTVARAREEGGIGDLVMVESLEGRKPFLARVRGIQEVEVYARAVDAREKAR